MFQSDVRIGATPANSHWREAFRLLQVRKTLFTDAISEKALADARTVEKKRSGEAKSHFEAFLCLRSVRQGFRHFRHIQEAFADSQRTGHRVSRLRLEDKQQSPIEVTHSEQPHQETLVAV